MFKYRVSRAELKNIEKTLHKHGKKVRKKDVENIDIEKFVKFYYRSTRHGAYTKTYLFKDGEVIEPVFLQRSRTRRHGEDYYYREDYEKADVVLTIDISNAGNHRCRMIIKRENPDSIRKALSIHQCPFMKIEKIEKFE